MSWQLAVLRRWLRWTARPIASRTRSWTFARRAFTLVARLTFRQASGTTTVETSGGLAPGLWVTRSDPQLGRVVLFLHGGAYVVGSPAIYSKLAGWLAQGASCPVYLPEYPLAPENPAPAAFDAALRAWNTLLGQGYRPSEIALCGDSAGGGLALAVLSHLLNSGVRPARCAVFAPWTDLSLTGKSLIANAPSDVLLPAERVAEVRDMVRGALDPADPRISPLFGRFPDCPPVYITYSESEILRDDAIRMAEALRHAGAEVTCEALRDAPHVWQLFHGWLPEADRSLARTGAFIAQGFRASPSSGS